jgi:hypothetical protein
MWAVYWLYDERCVCPCRHGYVGISLNVERRVRTHRKRFPDCEWKVLFEGTKFDCVRVEYQLRPTFDIGWNRARGGNKGNPGTGAGLYGKPKSAEHRASIAKTLTGHVRTTASRAKQSASAKGKPKPIEWRAMMSAKATKRYADPAERIKMSNAVKRGKRSKPGPGKTSFDF